MCKYVIIGNGLRHEWVFFQDLLNVSREMIPRKTEDLLAYDKQLNGERNPSNRKGKARGKHLI